jgi:pre-mRNA-splicing factor SYF2
VSERDQDGISVDSNNYRFRTARQYKRLVKEMPVNLEKYEQDKELLGEGIYGASNPILEGIHKDSPKA